VLLAREYYSTEKSHELHHRARDCLERAVADDPGYVDGWVWLSVMHLEEYRFGYNRRATPPLERAFAAAKQAVTADPASAMAHYSLACACYHLDQLQSFAVAAEQALTLNPNNALILAEMGQFFIFTGDGDFGVALTQKAMTLNPHHPGWYWWNVDNYHYAKREYEAALGAALKWNDPEFYWSQVQLARDYGQLGREAEARSAVQRLLELYPDFSSHAREEHLKWTRKAELVEHELDGLRKAGLAISS
jgi:tetratricopeptide (TPR) repeat protein